MNSSRRIFDLYLEANLHVALAVLALTQITERSLGISRQAELHLFIFFATVLAYNILKYWPVIGSDFNWFKRNPIISCAMLVGCAGSAIFFLRLQMQIQQFFLVIGLLVIAYPFLRKFGLAKMFLVSFCVSMITVFVPIMAAKIRSVDCYISLIQRFLIVISWLIPFEIADSITDHPSMRTLPQQFGISSAKIFGILLTVPFAVLEFFKATPTYITLVIAMVTVLFILFSNIHRNKYYTSFWVESIPIFWWMLLWFF